MKNVNDTWGRAEKCCKNRKNLPNTAHDNALVSSSGVRVKWEFKAAGGAVPRLKAEKITIQIPPPNPSNLLSLPAHNLKSFSQFFHPLNWKISCLMLIKFIFEFHLNFKFSLAACTWANIYVDSRHEEKKSQWKWEISLAKAWQ